jgi:hypothetical protein
MTAWWGREQREPKARRRGGRIALVAAEAPAIAAEVRQRVERFAPAWRGVGRDDDAGEAFVRLFGPLAASLAIRIDRLTVQTEVELLRAAGVVPHLGIDATTIVQFSSSEAARAPTYVGAGFRLGAAAASPEADRVEFETEHDLYVSPGRLVRARLQRGPFLRDVTVDAIDGAPFEPFTDAVRRRDEALWLGIASVVHPGRRLTLALGSAERAEPRPQRAGASVAPEPRRMLSWEAWSGTPRAATIVRDETDQLRRGGLIELALPNEWRPVVGPDQDGAPLYWLRLRLRYGELDEPIRLRFVLLDCTRARGSATFVNRRLALVPGSDGRSWQLPAKPVMREPLELEVDDPTAALLGEGSPRWRQVASLDDAGSADRVFELDHADGVVRFGDGVHGAALPPGFEHVRAPKFRVSFGAAAKVDAGAVSSLLGSAPLLLGVTNPLPAAGGRRPELRPETMQRGPSAIRARGRAVTPADVELLAKEAPGSLVARAHATAGDAADRVGIRRAGVVGVYVVGERGADGVPRIDEPQLLAVARHLRDHAPAGAEVVVAAARLLPLRAELAVVVDDRADPTTVVAGLIEALGRYFDPIHGGDGDGWPFGGTIRHSDTLRHLLGESGVRAIDRLTLTVDGVRHRQCTDVTLPPHTLLWPDQHEVIVVGGER